MSSRRLPGKMLLPLAGRPVLGHVLDRLRRTTLPVIVATSTHDDDDAIAEFCDAAYVPCHRGPLDDVVGRFAQVVEQRRLAGFVRVSGDSPLIDPTLVTRVATVLQESGDRYDLVTNVLPRSFPVGQSVEAMRAAPFLEGVPRITEAEDREHVTRFFYRNLPPDRICRITRTQDVSHVRLVVDTSDDLAHVASILDAMEGPRWRYGLAELLDMEQVASSS
jgi:spore coat polysaccharide biosynthesis protein SpsF